MCIRDSSILNVIKPKDKSKDNKEKKDTQNDADYIDYNDKNQDNDDDDDDEEEEDDGYQNVAKKTQSRGFGGFGFGGLWGNQNIYGQQPSKQKQKHLSELEEGKYSLFKIAVKNGWQGVAYLMLQSGYDLMHAIMDAMSEHKYQLVLTLLYKTADNATIQKANNEKQNLFHVFAINGSKAPKDLTEKIVKELKRRDVDYNSQDNLGRTALHYAAEKNFTFLIQTLQEGNVNPNQQDLKGHTPFTLLLMNQMAIHGVQEFIKNSKTSIDVAIRFREQNSYALSLIHI
eukprot:TRINITY_DN4655_c0_g1_i5.p1 TRINITY_DN4655_c0_g1~~TRINITY_DN4655_c0_g1_i5.p1  ORF type:complete len:286 (+),score=74.49 TRINITY_DN4655_c0_g1_i5:64-921(+)